MKIDDLKKVCVIGGGGMGRQIALQTAIFGYDVAVTDSFPNVLEQVRAWADKYLAGRIEKGKMTAEKVAEVKGRFHVVDSFEEAVKGSQLIIEAVFENKDVKHEVFKKVDAVADANAIIATNSSFMVSSTFKDDVKNPSRLANLHYFFPALVMRLVEVVQGEHTAPETIEFLMEFCRRTGKTPVHIRKEIDGFIANRIVRAVSNEAMYLVEQGIATPQEIDTAVELGLNYPMGPFRLQDLSGIDITYSVMKRRLEEEGVKPNGFDAVKAKYDAGELGRKTGKGWYDYTDEKK